MNFGGKRVAMVSGATGQTASYLIEMLLEKGYRVIGLKRRTSLINTDRVDHIYENANFEMEYYDLNDVGRIYELLTKYEPTEFYNLACQSHVKVSFEVSENTVDGIVMGTLSILNAIKNLGLNTKFYQASSSEMFGDNPKLPLNEESRLMPVSPYAVAKVFGHNIVRVYRESYGMHASSGILFNHCSPRRGETFVTRKITLAAAKIKLGIQDKLELGNLDAKRDWSFAGDVVEAMWLMLQQDKSDDYVVSAGEMHTVREFLEYVFELADLRISEHVVINPKYYRPLEVPALLGDCSKAKKILGWKPKTSFKELAEMMYDSDLRYVAEKY